MALPNARHFDFSDPALRQQLGLKSEGAGTIPVQTAFRRVRRQYNSREDLTKRVYAAVKESPRPLSRREIGMAIGYSKNGYLLAAIAELVALGRIVEHEDSWRGIPLFVYEAAL